MSDKSFGDHTFRNVVKNPLLSTAVTGLSIEDLTHNAVLLPVAQAQGESARQDQNAASKRTLGHTDYSTPNLSSGDSNSNILASTIPLDNNHNTIAPQQNVQNQKNNDLPTSSQSKASLKTDDDFDVNEYFARLHGTRYVSAPLTGLQKEQNANLEDTEENLEEINLNEPEKLHEDIQQSLTADIAQNFSQLPTVLPQVASAVFSSFSNMLSLKSREVTPDEGNLNTVFQDMQAQGADVGTPLMAVPNSGARELPLPPRAPPPKEPPTGGTANYRISTKKKAYAQIPGLSSGETSQKPYVPNLTDTQSYFVSSNVNEVGQVQNVLPVNPNALEFYNPQELKAPPLQTESVALEIKGNDSTKIPDDDIATQKDSYNIFNPVAKDAELKNENVPASDSQMKETGINFFDITPKSVETSQSFQNVYESRQDSINAHPQFSQGSIQILNQTSFSSVTESSVQGNTPIIPPPPMFSNLTRKNSQSNVGKSLLPPSVARRLAGGQPVIKSQPPIAAASYGNFFVPAPTPDVTAISPEISETLPLSDQSNQSRINPIATSLSSFPASSTSLQTSVIFPPSLNASLPSFANETIPSSTLSSSSEKSTANVLSQLPPSSANIPLQNFPSIPKPSELTLHDIHSQTMASNDLVPSLLASTSSGLPAQLPTIPNIPQSTSLPPPPTFFNPSTVEPVSQNPPKPEVAQNLQSNVSQFFTGSAESTSIPKPPKLIGSNTNFRMAKKRPQYYSGPIEGVGAISNNIKPVMPAVSSTPFYAPQANIFNQDTFTNNNNDNQAIKENVATHAIAQFDISRPPDVVPFELNKQETNIQPDCNTLFDLSRQTTECYEEPKQETKGFGLIGSLKSKLSSIDINKIQNSVTTFFDPTYNDTKKETSVLQENVPYYQQQNATYNQTQGTNFEIFVPNAHEATQSYDYQTSYENQVPAFGYNQNNQYYQTQDTNNYYQHENNHSNNYYTENYSQLTPQACSQANLNTMQNQPTISSTAYAQDNLQSSTFAILGNKAQSDNENISSLPTPQSAISLKLHEKTTHNETDLATKSFFDKPEVYCAPMLPKSDELNEKTLTSQIIQDNSNEINNKQIIQTRTDSQNNDAQEISSNTGFNLFSPSDCNLKPKEDLFTAFTFDSNIPAPNNFGTESRNVFPNLQANPEISTGMKNNIPTSDVSSVSLFGLSNIIVDKTKELNEIDLQTNKENFDSQEELKDNADNYNSTVSNFFSKSDATYTESEDKHGSLGDLNICETCREVNKLEEKEADNLTDQLIENITAPIQLLNPVEVPLNESNPSEDNDDFNLNQCAEISLVTEETIESLHVQTATEMLDDDRNDSIESYGWNTDNSPVVSSTNLSDRYLNYQVNIDDKDLAFASIPVDNDYIFEADPNSIGFFEDNSSFFDTIPNNASDELKAEFKHSHEEPPIVASHMSIPSAPPAEDHDRFDETGGLDVHSIEQDATMDCPVLAEYIIEYVEPSETDDDKIEYREREKSDDLTDTFTNRVERFKKMERTASDLNDDVFDYQRGVVNWQATSPIISIASYFDTGNYAAETHYRNLSSPTILTTVTGSPMRIPPGFEEEYQRRLSGMAVNTEQTQTEKKNEIVQIPECSTQTRTTTTLTFNPADAIKTVPDTSTQTRPINTFTYSYVEGSKTKDKAVVSNPITDLVEESKHISLSEFSRLFDIKRKEDEDTRGGNDSQVPNLANSSANTEVNKAEEEPPAFTSESIEPSQLSPESVTKSSSLSFNMDEKDKKSDTTLNCFNKSEELNVSGEPKKDTNSLFANLKPIENIENKSTTETLPDPINFFGNTSSSQETTDPGFNRLASYFISPAKTEPSKSFFELSQSQNHYRHTGEGYDFETHSQPTRTEGHKSFFQVGQSQNHYKENIDNIQLDKHFANLDLMRDLTSYDNLEIANDQTIRTVNYFTVEYDVIKTDLKKGESDIVNKKTDSPNLTDDAKHDTNNIELEADEINNDTYELAIKNCKYCCNYAITKTYLNFESVGDVRVREAMDYDNSETKKEREMNMDDNRDDSRRSTTIDVETYASDKENESVTMLTENRSLAEYTPVKHHWFYRVDCEGKSIWRGFSIEDSRALEDAFHSSDLSENTLVPTDGGRYDVNIVGRLRIAVYWSDKPTNVRRCSWFYKGTTDARYVPYTEAIAEKLEEEYRHGITTGEWHRRLTLPNNEMVVMHGPGVMVHFLHGATTDAFNTPNQSTTRPRVVRRGIDESEIEDTEPSHIDHLLLLCHGVGSACDMRFRAVEEVVDDFRTTSLQLLQSHYRNAYDSGIVSRVEVLPISWHATLHSGETGVDRRLAQITLDSIPRLRSFTNDTVLDVLFYTSPIFCQTIIDTVCKELNRIHSLFKKRNPGFSGGVSLGGHSLGSVILYDLLCHQNVPMPSEEVVSDKRYVTGPAGTGQPCVKYPKLDFAPTALYALGSPIAIFECIRGVDSLGLDFSLPTCKNFFNIFHPYDPIAYRIEPLLNSQLKNLKPFLIPHHKGRKRMHLELKDTMARVGADIKQKLVESIKATWASMWRSQPPTSDQLEKVVEEEIEKEKQELEEVKEEVLINDQVTPEMLGKLNSGRRVDYVLQEAPFEMINEYLFAMTSHVCYWESEDTMLLILREIYDGLGVSPDSTVPPPGMTVRRTRPPHDETIILNAAEHPSTSRGST